MEPRRIQYLVKLLLPYISEKFKLKAWHLRIQYEPVDDGMAECWTKPQYQRAVISIDINKVCTEEDVLDIMRHELLHVLHAHFETFRAACFQYVLDGPQREALDVVWATGCELTVKAMEDMLDSTGFDLVHLANYVKKQDKTNARNK